MADVLSQSEVESLLAALDPGAEQGALGAAGERGETNGTQINVYDFKRPERVSKEQMRAFQVLHEGFGREFGAALSSMLRNIVEVKLISVDQLTYSEFVFSLENPTCFNLLESEGLEGHVILDLNPSIIFPIIDRLLGGGRDVRFNAPTRPLTEIELRLVSRITDLAIKSLTNAWASVVDLGLRVTQIESNPQLVQIVPPNEVIVLVSFEVTMGDVRGIMNLCVPYNVIEPLSSKLSSDTWSTYTKQDDDPEHQRLLQATVKSAAVGIVVNLANTTLTTAEVSNLAVGDVIMTEKEVVSEIEMFIEDRLVFRGHPGTHRGQRAVRITSGNLRPASTTDAT
ncbi:MAG: flagellar motor switch protein FliM [Planctomycetaceae bacterium]